MGLNDAAWEELFQRLHIADALERDGLYRISADEIRKLREPRLMTKFDHAVNLPRVFADRGLAILPVSRGDYVISSFTPRQAAYYSAAGRYLGLAEHLREQGCARHALSERGQRVMRLPLRERKLALAVEILKHAAFRETLRAVFASGAAELPPRGGIVDIMRRIAPGGVEGESTFVRRASTVRGWIRWILGLTGHQTPGSENPVKALPCQK